MYKLPLDNLDNFLQIISNKQNLYLPVKDEDITDYGVYTHGCTVDLVTLKTVSSPKKYFLPSYETLYKSKITKENISIEASPFSDNIFVLFGVRACDLRGIEVLDNVFLKEPVDKFYKSRRDAAVIFSLACEKQAPTCFCNSLSIDQANPLGDVTMKLVSDCLYFKPNTKKGEQALEESLGLLTKSDMPEVIPATNPLLPIKDINFNELLEKFESDQWDKLYRTCISCSTCTFICSTCQCYDISTFNSQNVICHRTWDSCMHKDYTQMAHGNPRPTEKARFRNRFMHKFMYSQENNEFSCTGCGRCTNKCPVNVSITKVIKMLVSERSNENAAN